MLRDPTLETVMT